MTWLSDSKVVAYCCTNWSDDFMVGANTRLKLLKIMEGWRGVVPLRALMEGGLSRRGEMS